MVKAFEKARKVIEKEGSTPRFYTRYIVELDDYVTKVLQTNNSIKCNKAKYCSKMKK